MQVDDIHAIISVGGWYTGGISLARVNTALKVKEGLVFIEAEFLFLTNDVQ